MLVALSWPTTATAFLNGCAIEYFEPRVTSKLNSMTMDEWGVHGRGMALYSVRENAERAECIASVEGKGSIFLVEFDCSKTPEKSDQSTPPSLVKQSVGTWTVSSGPHNILKTASEFALANRDVCTLYLGSIIDSAATMYAFGRQFLIEQPRALLRP